MITRVHVYSLPVEDLENIFARINDIWPRNKSVLLTGGTGFFGRWITESIAYVETKLKSGNTFTVTSRQSKAVILEKIPVLKETFFNPIQVDLKDSFQLASKFDYVIHAAGDVSLAKGNNQADFSDMVRSTSNLISAINSSCRFMSVSSGSVYSNSEGNTTEQHPVLSTIQNIDSYGKGKRQSEYFVKKLENHCIARCFSFVGPFADSKMAVMDMLNKKVHNHPVTVNSPDVVRSYLYPTDLVISLFKILLKKSNHSEYNVGSPIPITLGELAKKISGINSISEVQFLNEDQKTSFAGKYYYPNTDRYDADYGPILTMPLDEALLKTYNFLTQRRFHEKF